MDVEKVVSQIKVELRAVSTPDRARNEKAYQKSDLDFIGVTVPEIRRIARATFKANKTLDREGLWRLFERLWRERIWETRFVAMILLELFQKLLGPQDLHRLRELVVESSCWAFNDWFGCHVVGRIVATNPGTLAEIDTWAADQNLWLRRVAMQSLLIPMRDGNLTEWPRFVRYAEPNLGAKDFWTRKVVGWVLREVSKKNPAPVFEFLLKHRQDVSGLTLREGAKYLPVADRAALGL